MLLGTTVAFFLASAIVITRTRVLGSEKEGLARDAFSRSAFACFFFDSLDVIRHSYT